MAFLDYPDKLLYHCVILEKSRFIVRVFYDLFLGLRTLRGILLIEDQLDLSFKKTIQHLDLINLTVLTKMAGKLPTICN